MHLLAMQGASLLSRSDALVRAQRLKLAVEDACAGTATADQWRVIKVVAGDMGQIEKFRLKVTDSVCEFAVAVFAKEVNAAWVTDKIGKPVIDHWWQTETGWAISANPAGLCLLEAKAGSATVPVPVVFRKRPPSTTVTEPPV